MIIVVPAATPVTIAFSDPTVAAALLLLLHTPPAIASLSVVVKPAHTVAVPVTDAGSASIVTVVVVAHPPAE